MKPYHLLAAALVALLVGGGAGYFFGVENASAPSRSGPVDSGDEGVAQAPDPEAAPGGTGTDTGADPQPIKPKPAPAPVVPGDAGALAAWLASLAGEKPTAGTGRVWGRVTLKDGSPVPDVEVTASSVYPTLPVTPDKEESLEEEIERYARRTVFRRAGKVTATTGADGSFEFSGLGDYDYWVSAKAKGFQFEQTGRSRRNGNARPDAEVNFLAKPVCELDLDVRLPDGTQPKTANPMVQSGNSSRGGFWRPEQTTSTYEPGKGMLTVKAGDYEEYQSDPIEIELVEQQTLKLSVNLKAVAGILCKLKIPAELGPETRPQVTLQPDPPAEAPATVPRVRDMRSNYRDEGEVAFVNLKPGPYRLIVSLGAQILVWQDVQLGDEFKIVEMAVPEPDRGDFIVVRVNGPDGKPAPRVRLSVNVRSETNSGGNTRTIEKPDGSFWVTRAKPDERRFPADKPWWYEVTATCDAFGITVARHDSAATGELVMQYAQPAMLTILIPGAATHPLKARLRPSLSRSEGENRGWDGINGGRPARNGLDSDTLKYGPLSPGKYRFVLTLARADDEEWWGGGNQICEMTFDITSGDNTQSCAIPVLCKLTIVIADPKTVNNLTLRRIDGKGENRNAWGDNIKERTVFEGLAAGEWVVGTREGEMPVTLSGDREVTLAVRKFDCLRLGGIKSGGKIEALGLRDGDKLIRVDGTEIEGTESTQVVMMSSLAKESTTWTVLRGGRSVDVTFNGKDLMKIMTDRTEGDREYFNPRPATRD